MSPGPARPGRLRYRAGMSAASTPVQPTPAASAGRPVAGRPPSSLALAWRQTLRDFRAGELRLLAVAVMLAVAALSAVGFFADRLSAGLNRDAGQLLGGDAVVASDRPTPPSFAEQAAALGLREARTIGFPSMARAPDERGGDSRLVAVKAVTPNYPLRGQMQLRGAEGTAVETVARAPAPGTVWVDPALLDALQLKVGDPLLLGDATLRIDRVIVTRPAGHAGRGRPGGHGPDPAGQPRHLPLCRHRRAGPGGRRASVRALGRGPHRAGLAAGLAGRVAGKRPAGDAAGAGPRRAFPEPRGAAGRPARGGGGGHRRARLRAAPPRRLRHAARAGSAAAAHRQRVRAGVPLCRTAGQPGGTAGGPAGAARLRVAAGRTGAGRTAGAGLEARRLRPGRGPDAAGGFRPAARAAAGPRAAAARHPARRGRHQGHVAVGAAGGRRRLCRTPAGRVQRRQAGPHRGGRLCRGGGRVCGAGLGGRGGAASRRARNPRAALARAGHATDRGATGVCGAAGVGAVGGPARAGAAGAAAHRPHRQLAAGHAGRRAQPLHHQPAARAGRALPRGDERGRRHEVRLVPDDPRPPGGHQRPGRHGRPLQRGPRAAPGGARVQHQPCRHAARPQPRGGGPLGARRGRRPVGGGWRKA